MKAFHLSFILLMLTPHLALSQTVYTWVDNDGTLHFSETPQSTKAKALNLPDHSSPALPPQFEQAQQAASSASTASPKLKSTHKELIALEIEIISPNHDEALRSNSGNITVQGDLNRKLSIGEQLQLMLDGKKYGAPKNQANWQLSNIDRGTHSFMIQAFRDGKLIASSKPITVHLQRASVKKVQATPRSQ